MVGVVSSSWSGDHQPAMCKCMRMVGVMSRGKYLSKKFTCNVQTPCHAMAPTCKKLECKREEWGTAYKEGERGRGMKSERESYGGISEGEGMWIVETSKTCWVLVSR